MSLAGCKSVNELFETELDDSAEGMSGRWDVVEVTESDQDCETLGAADSSLDSLVVRIVDGDAPAPEDRDAGANADAGKVLDVEVCAGQKCGPVAERYSLFEKAENGWRLEEFRADWSRYPACLARRVQATFVLLPEDKARLEEVRAVGGGMVEGQEDCNRAFARERRDTLECSYRRVFELRRPTDEAS